MNWILGIHSEIDLGVKGSISTLIWSSQPAGHSLLESMFAKTNSMILCVYLVASELNLLYYILWPVLKVIIYLYVRKTWLVALKLGPNDCHFAENIFKCILKTFDFQIKKKSLRYDPQGLNDKMSALVHRSGNGLVLNRQQLSLYLIQCQPSSLAHTCICITQP